jgi:hypothetical protein
LGKKGPIRAEWYHLCDLKEQRFQDLLKLAKETPPDERTRDMTVVFRRVKEEARARSL